VADDGVADHFVQIFQNIRHGEDRLAESLQQPTLTRRLDSQVRTEQNCRGMPLYYWYEDSGFHS
jgi:hypothetical protein